jgi:hypothetical protein
MTSAVCCNPVLKKFRNSESLKSKMELSEWEVGQLQDAA